MRKDDHPFDAALDVEMKRIEGLAEKHRPSPEKVMEMLRSAKAAKAEEKQGEISRKIIPLWRKNWALAAAAVLVIGVTLAVFWPPPVIDQIAMATLPDSERTGAVALPKNLKLDLKGRRLELSEGGDRLAGPIEPLPAESSPGVTAFNVTLSGRDTAGTEGRFQGKLWLTNTAGATAIRKQADVAGARMRGSFEISGKGSNAVEQVFIPTRP